MHRGYGREIPTAVCHPHYSLSPHPLPPPVSLARVLSQVARAVAAKFFSDSTSNVGGLDLTNNVQLTQSTPFWCQAIGALLTLYVAV